MANHPSARKRHRQSEKRRVRNLGIMTRLRHLVRRVRTALASRDSEAAVRELGRASRALDKAVTKGVVHRRSASRKISRLAHAVSELKAGSARS